MGIFVPYLRKHGNVSSGGKVQIVHLTISTFTEGQINKRQMISTEYLKDENFHFEPLQLTQKKQRTLYNWTDQPNSLCSIEFS